jgi:putative DNA methylase
MAPVKRKLIEVALPLEAINVASAREKSIRHGHPSTLHLWWARRPLAACRAVLFSSLVDDPSSDPDRFPTPKAVEDERTRLFGIIERLVLWENSTNEVVLEEARAEIRRSTGGNPPTVLDPFCGGGSIPLEAQRLGLTAYASDLNPVAVLITKALIEIPPKFANQPPVHPDARRGVGGTGAWKGASGLAEDVHRYGTWMRDEAERRIGHLYPKVSLPKEKGGGEATVIAWLWARTVICPNPACGARMPLVRSFALSTMKGKEAWVEPIIDRAARSVRFEVRTGGQTPPDGTVDRQGARCLVCESPVPLTHVRAEGRAGRMDARLMAIVAEAPRGRIYLSGTSEHEAIARSAEPGWAPETDLPEQALGFRIQAYGMTKHRDLFTPRQLVALTTFSDLVREAREHALRDAHVADTRDDSRRLAAGGIGAAAYADAVATYLAFAVDKGANLWSSITSWMSDRGAFRETFARQAIPMVWDFAEASPFRPKFHGPLVRG